MSILLHIDHRSKTPVFKQITGRVIELIDSEVLTPGEKLPASRTLADQLGVNRSTVYKAYQELWALGYIESTPGSYSTVRSRAKLVTDEDSCEPPLIDWHRQCRTVQADMGDVYRKETDLAAKLYARAQTCGATPAVIDFTPLVPDERYFPVDEYRKCVAEVYTQRGRNLLGYGDPQGYEPLREYIAERLQLHGVHSSTREIMITTGAQSALSLIFTAYTSPGEKVVVESPTYSRAIGLAKLHGVELLPIEMQDDGMDLEQLKQVVAAESPSLIYTIPNFHNPTGITSSQSHREALLRIAESYKVPIVEDGFEEEMKYFGKAVLPIKSMDRRGIVLYVGTFSKVLFPGVRIGWIAGDETALEQLTALQKFSQLSGSSIDQAALNLYCRRGHYENHIKRMHRIYRTRMLVALQSLDEFLTGTAVAWTRPAGGYTLWLHMSGGSFEEEEILHNIAAQGVLVSPGRFHYSNGSQGIAFRISIGAVEEAQIKEGIRRVAGALTSVPA